MTDAHHENLESMVGSPPQNPAHAGHADPHAAVKPEVKETFSYTSGLTGLLSSIGKYIFSGIPQAIYGLGSTINSYMVPSGGHSSGHSAKHEEAHAHH